MCQLAEQTPHSVQPPNTDVDLVRAITTAVRGNPELVEKSEFKHMVVLEAHYSVSSCEHSNRFIVLFCINAFQGQLLRKEPHFDSTSILNTKAQYYLTLERKGRHISNTIT